MKTIVVLICIFCSICIYAQKITLNDLYATCGMKEADFTAYFINKGLQMGHRSGFDNPLPEFYGENGDVSTFSNGVVNHHTPPEYSDEIAGVIRKTCTLLDRSTSQDAMRNEICLDETFKLITSTRKYGIEIHQCESFISIMIFPYDHFLFQRELNSIEEKK